MGKGTRNMKRTRVPIHNIFGDIIKVTKVTQLLFTRKTIAQRFLLAVLDIMH